MNKPLPFPNLLKRTLRDAFRICRDLYKILIPVIFLVKVLQELDLIPYLARPLSPLMGWVGLPGEMGLVWATALLNTLYSSLVVFLTLVRDNPLTVSQMTVLCTLMLIAHSIPVELKIAQKTGTRMLFQAVCRLGCALLLGGILHRIYTGLNVLQQPLILPFQLNEGVFAAKTSLLSWGLGQIRNLLLIFLIIVGLLLLMEVLERIKLIDLMNRLLRPVLKLLGIGPNASTIAIFGITLGIVIGGGLIIHEAKTGHIPKQDVFYALTLMGLSHSLIEDTLVLMVAGAHLSGILWARVVFSMILVGLIVKGSRRLPASFCDRFLWGDPK